MDTGSEWELLSSCVVDRKDTGQAWALREDDHTDKELALLSLGEVDRKDTEVELASV